MLLLVALIHTDHLIITDVGYKVGRKVHYSDGAVTVLQSGVVPHILDWYEIKKNVTSQNALQSKSRVT